MFERCQIVENKLTKTPLLWKFTRKLQENGQEPVGLTNLIKVTTQCEQFNTSYQISLTMIIKFQTRERERVLCVCVCMTTMPKV